MPVTNDGNIADALYDIWWTNDVLVQGVEWCCKLKYSYSAFEDTGTVVLSQSLHSSDFTPCNFYLFLCVMDHRTGMHWRFKLLQRLCWRSCIWLLPEMFWTTTWTLPEVCSYCFLVPPDLRYVDCPRALLLQSWNQRSQNILLKASTVFNVIYLHFGLYFSHSTQLILFHLHGSATKTSPSCQSLDWMWTSFHPSCLGHCALNTPIPMFVQLTLCVFFAIVLSTIFS